MRELPLIHSVNADAPLAWVHGAPISRRSYLEDVAHAAAQLPQGGAMLNLSQDRYRFALGLGAALQRGQANLLPPNHTPDMVARLRQRFPGTYLVGDDDSAAGHHRLQWPAAASGVRRSASPSNPAPMPALRATQIAAQVLTSGSTGDPVPYAKPWGLLWRNSQVGAARIAAQLGRSDLEGVSLVATVPAQHMYGFESSVLIALHSGAAFEASRPFYPADICAALARIPQPRILVTTPLHLKTLLDSKLQVPALDLCLCATALLAPQLAARAEAQFDAPLMEIYGCTEAGQVATRRTTLGPTWRTYDGVSISGDPEHPVASGGHVPQATQLADVLEMIDATQFRLLGRSNDLINIAGKRSSLSHLNFHLNAIDGVHDGAFWLPPQGTAADAGVVRLVAFVVAPQVTREALLARLRERVDAAFLPRRIVWLDALPRDPSGKLPSSRLAELAAQRLGGA